MPNNIQWNYIAMDYPMVKYNMPMSIVHMELIDRYLKMDTTPLENGPFQYV
jgi:hypothetical protein